MSIVFVRRAAAGDFDSDVLDWVRTGFCRYLDGDGVEQALALDRASLLRQRNDALCAAASLLINDAGEAWQTAERLAAAIRRFETRILPLWRRNPSLILSPLDCALLEAFETGQRIPRTQRNLFTILR